MVDIDITHTLTLSDDEAAAIADALSCSLAELEDQFGLYAPAASREYLEMFAGQAMTTASDLRERRLLAILITLGDFPADEAIARLFNLTATGARTLLRSTISRHRNRLKGVLEAAVRRFLIACKQFEDGGVWEARSANIILIELLNGQLASASELRAPIRRKASTFDTYVVSNGAKNELDDLYP